MFRKTVILCLLLLLSIPAVAQKMNIQKLDSLFDLLAKNDRFMGSIALTHEGNIIYQRAIGYDDLEHQKKSSTDSRYRVGSISKMFTSALIFKAVEDKLLDLDAPLATYFPSIQNAKKITVGNLLNHRSGIFNITNDPSYGSWNTKPQSRKELLARIVKGGSIFEPDSKADYSNSNYILLTFILEDLHQKSFKTIVKEGITGPLGLQNTYVGSKIDPDNNEAYSYRFDGKWTKQSETDMSLPLGAGAMVSTPSDLLKFIEALFAEKIITKESLTKMTTLRDNFGMGIFQFPFNEKRALGHTGGIDSFGSMLGYFKEDQLGIALTSNATNYNNNDIVIGALSAFYNTPYTLPVFANIVFTSDELNPYLGIYASPDIPLKITITEKDNSLMAQATGQGAFPLEAQSKTVFEFKAAGVVMEFMPEKNEMVLKQGGGTFTFTKE